MSCCDGRNGNDQERPQPRSRPIVARADTWALGLPGPSGKGRDCASPRPVVLSSMRHGKSGTYLDGVRLVGLGAESD